MSDVQGGCETRRHTRLPQTSRELASIKGLRCRRRKVQKSLELGADNGVNAHNRRALCTYYLKPVMASMVPDGTSHGSLRRHLILHGGDCTYGTPAMS